ncbi:MAG: hypothetical protein QG609_447 [Patescibacteria group bacterium]|nr:hypothetical protein [Patescibacteria group bacterium]
MKNFKPKIKFLILLSLIWLAPVEILAAVDGFVFTLNPAEVVMGEATQFTIQAQDAGAEAAVPETFDIYLESDSSSGSFSSNGSNWQAVDRVTMSKNTKNKNFYYKDSELKVVNISVVAKNRVTGEEWNLEHSLSVVDQLTEVEDEDDDNEDSSGSSNPSSHSSPAALSTKKAVTKFEVDIGRERLVLVGVPIEFEAILSNDISGVDYDWSFGDGGSEAGREVSYIYKYPGVYNVVLNAESKDSPSVDRTEVTVVEANLGLEILPSNDKSIAIVNNADTEVNIGNFILDYGNGDIFVFAKDTILNSGARLVVDQEMTRTVVSELDIENISLKINDTEVVADLAEATSTVVVLGLEERSTKLEELKLEAVKIKNILDSRQALSIPSISTLSEQIEISTSTKVAADDTIEPKTIVLDKPVGLWDKILVLPDRGFNFLSNIF